MNPPPRRRVEASFLPLAIAGAALLIAFAVPSHTWSGVTERAVVTDVRCAFANEPPCYSAITLADGATLVVEGGTVAGSSHDVCRAGDRAAFGACAGWRWTTVLTSLVGCAALIHGLALASDTGPIDRVMGRRMG